MLRVPVVPLVGVGDVTPCTTGYIDARECAAVMAEPLYFLIAIDGSEESKNGFNYVVEEELRRERESTIDVLHFYDDAKTYLAPGYRSNAIHEFVEARLVSSVSANRYTLSWKRKTASSVGELICKHIALTGATFACMGFRGRKGKRDTRMLTSNVYEVLTKGKCSLLIFKDEKPDELPLSRAATFVVSVSPNQASTKAFLDCLKLSKPGDQIYGVYVQDYSEDEYSVKVRERFSGLFSGLREEDAVLHKFEDRKATFHFVQKPINQTIAKAVVQFAESVNADFICVGTNALRSYKGKPPLGSVSLEICIETDRNLLISSWYDPFERSKYPPTPRIGLSPAVSSCKGVVAPVKGEPVRSEMVHRVVTITGPK